MIRENFWWQSLFVTKLNQIVNKPKNSFGKKISKNCEKKKNQTGTKLKKSNFDNSKIQIVTKLEKSKLEPNPKFKLWQNSKILFLIKLKNSNH